MDSLAEFSWPPKDADLSALSMATFAGGCFWGVEENFRQIKGVSYTAAGYSGGHFEKPSYEDVCTGQTAHAEVVQLYFDPSVTSFPSLVDAFMAMHDPTTKDRQGYDVGSQYRSAIFYHDEKQKAVAEEKVAAYSKDGVKAVTEVSSFTNFFPAEDYHQKYIAKQNAAGRNVKCSNGVCTL